MRIFLTAWFLVTSFSIWADIDIDPQNIGVENIAEPAKSSPYSIDIHADVVGGSRIDNGFYKKDKIDYAEASAEAGMTFYYCPRYTEGARAAVAYTSTYLKWHGNPWFEQDRFNTLSITLAGFTQRMDRWFWRAQLSTDIDTQEWSAKYMTYDMLLWGRYDLCKNIGIHFGFLAETGLRLDRVYPVIGFDWQISEKWKLNLVFPVNMSLLYSISPKWSMGIAGRLFNSRFRVKHDQHSSKPLVRYTNLGAEFIVQYEVNNLSANFHAGSTLWGKYRVANHRNDHARSYDLNPAAYFGAEVNFKF